MRELLRDELKFYGMYKKVEGEDTEVAKDEEKEKELEKEKEIKSKSLIKTRKKVEGDVLSAIDDAVLQDRAHLFSGDGEDKYSVRSTPMHKVLATLLLLAEVFAFKL